MTNELENIDLLRARVGVGYREAKEALDEVDGDVVQALINLEERGRHLSEKLQGRSKEVMGQFRQFLSKGHNTKIKVKKDGETVLEIPATVGVAGIVGAMYSNELALLGVAGAVAAMANDYRFEIEVPMEQATDYTSNYRSYL
ncbi:DUF4342 domain-containing protein [Peptococcaceae bacterium 1198_IL3148]